jgi:hypothetical protein
MNAEVQMTKPEDRARHTDSFIIRASAFFRASSFVIRHFSHALIN